MAYHALGLFHIMHAEYGKVEGYYLKSERITKRLGNMVHLAQIRNGFGYFAHQGGRYDVAERYFSKALRTALEADDHHEVCMALCNLGINALVCGRYDRASSFLCALPPIMRSLGMRELPYHSMTGI
jgi:Tfp pilus assembly protein PilF